MSLETGYHWAHGDLKLIGYSLAGISTSVAFPAADACFDVAQGLPFQIPFKHLLITHGHMDHASGLPYLIGQKSMRGAKPPEIYVPRALEAPVRAMMKLWSEVEEHAYPFTLNAVGPGDEFPLKGNYFARVFATYHRVPSQGYVICERKKRLKPEFVGQSPADLGRARHRGLVIDDHYVEPVVAFTGDTKIEFLEDDLVRRARVLITEATYWDDKKTIENAREWGHIHLRELIPWLDRVTNEKIVLIHTSARYSKRALERILSEEIPEAHRGRLELFPRPD